LVSGQTTSLEQKSSHPSTHLLSIVHQVELVDIVVHAATRLRQSPEIGNERHVVTLVVELVLELCRADDGQSMTQTVHLSQYLVILHHLALFDVTQVLQDDLYATVQHLDSVVLRQQVLGGGRRVARL